MKSFSDYLNKIGEVGYVVRVLQSIVHVEGLPGLHIDEVVLFENGAQGICFGLFEDFAEILLIDYDNIFAGEEVARTAQYSHLALSDHLLGSMIDPVGNILVGSSPIKIDKYQVLDRQPHGIVGRKEVNMPFSTGVKMVDVVVPLGKGQRELVIGDRKTGKTLFLQQTLLAQAQLGTICIYAAIAKQQEDITDLLSFIKQNKIENNVIVVASGAADAAGKVFLTPFAAMTIAEYYRDKGKDSLVILDDMSAHAKYYREITLESNRFPGRSSYPGDIFYTHAKLIERAGNFSNAAITCLPVAETILGDLSGYIQTNLMAMTDGHIYFDIDRFNNGQRPPVNPFLSVTRVGLQAQSPLVREISRHISSFLVQLDEMREFMHFGAEVSEKVKSTLSLGDKLMILFDQDYRQVVPINVTVYLIAFIWSGKTKGMESDKVREYYSKVISQYQNDQNYRKVIDSVVAASPSLKDLIAKVKSKETTYAG